MQVAGPDPHMQMCFEDAQLHWSGQSGMAALKTQWKEV